MAARFGCEHAPSGSAGACVYPRLPRPDAGERRTLRHRLTGHLAVRRRGGQGTRGPSSATWRRTNGTPGSCCTSSCQLRANGRECRAAAGVCDSPRTAPAPARPARPTRRARPSAAVAPAGVLRSGRELQRLGDAARPTSSPRRAPLPAGSGDSATPPRTAPARRPTCPADVDSPAGTVCNPGSGDVCDPDETCTGAAGQACPADTSPPADTVCRPAPAISATPTRTAPGSRTRAAPPTSSTPAGTVCKPGSGDLCDPDETCTGTAGQPCPADTVVLRRVTICRTGSGDLCDPDEYCTGIADQGCPADVVRRPARSATPARAMSVIPTRPAPARPASLPDRHRRAEQHRLPRRLRRSLRPRRELHRDRTRPVRPTRARPPSTVCRARLGRRLRPDENCTGTAGRLPDGRRRAEHHRLPPGAGVLRRGRALHRHAGPRVRPTLRAVSQRAVARTGSATSPRTATGVERGLSGRRRRAAVCRASAGVCDVAESCNGSSTLPGRCLRHARRLPAQRRHLRRRREMHGLERELPGRYGSARR